MTITYETYDVNNDFAFNEIKSLKYSCNVIFSKKELLTRTERDILFVFLNLWRIHWNKTGCVSKDKKNIAKIKSVSCSERHVARALSKLRDIEILKPTWSEKGGNIATRYIIDCNQIYTLSGGKYFKSDFTKLNIVTNSYNDIKTGKKLSKSNSYNKEVISNILVLQKCQGMTFCHTYIYTYVPVSKLRKLTYNFRKLGLVSHYQYIQNAYQIITGQEISLKQIYKIEMMEKKEEPKKVDKETILREKFARFHEASTSHSCEVYEGMFPELR